jgi:Uma2 family endonuclease
MPTVIGDPQPAEVTALIERRHKLDLDRCDEVWEGVLHMNPAPHRRHARVLQRLAVLLEDPAVAAGLVAAMGDFNLGEPDDYRVPDGGLFRPSPDEVYCPTAALVVEILSPGDETWDKLPFYAAHEVDELLVVDPEEHVVHWMALKSGEYVDVESSDLIALGPAELADQIDWP